MKIDLIAKVFKLSNKKEKALEWYNDMFDALYDLDEKILKKIIWKIKKK